MANRDIILTIVVLLGIGWLIFENYHRAPPAQPATTQTKSVDK